MLKYFLAVVCLLGLSGSLLAEEYVIFFTATGQKGDVESYHTYATFLKKNDKGKLDSRTISWMPRTRKIQQSARQSEEGVNLDVTETNRWAKEIKADVVRYGPYRVEDGLFEKASSQVSRLESGIVKYKYQDGKARSQATNGYNAIADVWVPKNVKAGDESDDLVTHFQSWYLAGGPDDHGWVLRELRIEHIRHAK